MTPLVDVVLVLLIIFMVVTPQMDKDLPVELPGIFHPDPDLKNTVDPIKVSVAKRGEYYIDKDRFDLDGAIDSLAAARADDPNRRLVLRADGRLTYGDVREIFARAQKIGFPGIALMVNEKHRSDVAEAAAATE